MVNPMYAVRDLMTGECLITCVDRHRAEEIASSGEQYRLQWDYCSAQMSWPRRTGMSQTHEFDRRERRRLEQWVADTAAEFLRSI